MNRAVFFDRDNTLMYNVPYLGDPNRVVLMPGAKEAVKRLHQARFKIILITNQSGVGRGLITTEQVAAVNDQLLNLIGRDLFTDVYCCYDDPNDPKENCRKPNPDMLLRAAKDHDLDLPNSYIIGDRIFDVKAGTNAGCKTLYFLTDYHPEENAEAKKLAHYTSDTLADLADWIIRNQQEPRN